MSAESLLRNLGRLGDTKDSIVRLRPFLLDLAVRGMLTNRLPADEPAATLLSRITAGRTAATSRWRQTPLAASDQPFALPSTWIWTRTRAVTSDRGQTTPSEPFTYIDVTAIDKATGRVRNPAVLAPEDAPSRARKAVAKGDVIYSCVRPYLLNIAVIEDDIDPTPVASTAFAVLAASAHVVARYLWAVLRSPYFVDCVEDKMRGQAYPAINDSDFAMLPIPLPPIAEQHRIVAKVDELMALCDELESAQTHREARRDRLRTTTLRNLVALDESKANARFFLRHSPRMITKPEHVSGVRRAILDLAVLGRLVQHVSEWMGVTPPRVCSLIVDGDHNPPPRQSRGVPHLTAKNVAGGKIRLDGCSYISEADFLITKKRYAPLVGDVLLTCVGTLGRTAIVPEGIVFSADRNLAALRPDPATCTSPFLKLVLDSPSAQAVIASASGQTAQPHIYLKDIRALEFMLPPLAEQDRIVAKVDGLMVVCDELEQSLATEQTERGRLLEALLHDALEDALPARELEALGAR